MLAGILAGFALIVTAGAFSLAQAQEAGDADKGLDYASSSCAFCHAVRKGEEPSPNPLAPSFEGIANRASMTMSLATTLHTIYDNILSEEDRTNILAHILRLKH